MPTSLERPEGRIHQPTPLIAAPPTAVNSYNLLTMTTCIIKRAIKHKALCLGCHAEADILVIRCLFPKKPDV